MNERDDGGPAYPGSDGSTGMTLRDYFAGQALGEWVRAHIEGSVDDLSKKVIARECYGYADAMIAERSKG
jgi:hypothetical protein